MAEQAAWANWAGEGSSGRRGVNGPVWIGLAGRVRTLGGFGLRSKVRPGLEIGWAGLRLGWLVGLEVSWVLAQGQVRG